MNYSIKKIIMIKITGYWFVNSQCLNNVDLSSILFSSFANCFLPTANYYPITDYSTLFPLPTQLTQQLNNLTT